MLQTQTVDSETVVATHSAVSSTAECDAASNRNSLMFWLTHIYLQ